ncbi:MAG: hypothetical protein HUJ68_08075 [Clostridia bacterium]|nr:hypothetical protein [Clostridia bacterium]
MNYEIRQNIKNCLRDNLLGKENQLKREYLKESLYLSDSTLKSWTSLTDSKIPVTEDLPKICEILGITLNQFFGIEDCRIVHAMKLENAYQLHPNRQEVINVLLEIDSEYSEQV